MDAPIASVSFQPTASRSIDFGRVEPAPSSPSTNARPDRDSSVSGQVAARLDAERSVSFDSETGSLVYRLIDISSGLVTSQTPSDARLRLRAYIDSVVSSNTEPAVEVTA